MHTENEVLIRADVGTIYRLAAEVENWPSILPHYRRVRVLVDHGTWRLVEMCAWRDSIPVSWRAEQRLFPTSPRITFRHMRGVTTGMEVEWTFTPTPEGVRVAISHDLDLAWPLIGGIAADLVIGPQFVEYIAGKTLRQIKLLAENEMAARPMGEARSA